MLVVAGFGALLLAFAMIGFTLGVFLITVGFLIGGLHA